MNTEANEIPAEDLAAAAEHYERMTQRTSPQMLAVRYAKERHGIEILPPTTLDRILGRFACSNSPIEECVDWELEQRPVTVTPAKKFTVEVKLSLFYEFSGLPEWADELGAEKLLECAFDNVNKQLTLQDLGRHGFLKMEPVEISVDKIMSA